MPDHYARLIKKLDLSVHIMDYYKGVRDEMDAVRKTMHNLERFFTVIKGNTFKLMQMKYKPEVRLDCVAFINWNKTYVYEHESCEEQLHFVVAMNVS